MKKMTAILLTLITLSLTACSSGVKPTGKEPEFIPKLDTLTATTIEMAGFMGNFEALDQVINAFNEIYPNVVFTYDHNTAFMLSDYLKNNANVDIFMTSDQNITQPFPVEFYVADQCLDLSKEDIDTSFILPDAINACTIDGQLLRLPIMMFSYGMVVNKTLLKNEGLSMPENYEEFISVLEALKEKGYTPLQGSQSHLYGELMINMAMNILSEDKTLITALEAGDEKAAAALKPVFERLETIINNGYTDYELNCTFPEDNYNESILSFYEGNMPFYVCNAECVSGMKKRESKSETFSASPFDYEFVYAPLGDNGVYVYTQPWYGFSINKNSDEKEMAVEFLRFMSNADTLDNMASTKGLPSVVIGGSNERYAGITNVKNINSQASYDGSISNYIRDTFIQVCNDFGAGVYKNSDEAVHAFVELCAE